MALSAQLLLEGPGGNSGAERTFRTIDALGYVQIDTISVVERAHHHTLWSRFGGYCPDILHRLHSEDRKVFEYWGHAASYLPISDYRFYTRQMKRHRDPKDKWARNRLEKCGHLMDDVLDRIRREGPLGSGDFKAAPGVKRAQWWDWKPAKTALELLFWRGDLMITRRDNFHRIYDLTERVLPDGTDTSTPEEDELGRFLVRRALRAHGTADERTMADHIHAADRSVVRRALLEMVDSGEVLAASVDGDTGYYLLEDAVDAAGTEAAADPGVHILSPFDNLIIDRKRAERLFGFRYSLECYTPRKKRKYGYFVLPVLWGDTLAALMDCKVHRKERCLQVISLRLELPAEDMEAFIEPFSRRLEAFARFNGCRSLDLTHIQPDGYRSPLESELEATGLEVDGQGDS